MSKDDAYAFSQSVTTIGIVEQMVEGASSDDLIRHTAKRSVFTADSLHAMNPSASAPVKMIDFLLAAHIEPPVALDTLVQTRVFCNRPPQSISELTEERYAGLKPYLALGLDL